MTSLPQFSERHAVEVSPLLVIQHMMEHRAFVCHVGSVPVREAKAVEVPWGPFFIFKITYLEAHLHPKSASGAGRS